MPGPAASALIARLKTLPPQTFHVAFFAGSPEARELAFQLQALLTAGGWASSGIAPTEEATIPLGIGLPRRTQASNALVGWATQSGFTPDVRVAPNLKEIHIAIGAQ